MYVEVIASPTNSTISTRGEALPDQGIQAPLVSFAGLLAVLAVLVAWILWRRRRRKLEVWQRRNIENGGNGRGPDSGTDAQSAAVSGMRATPEERDQHS